MLIVAGLSPKANNFILKNSRFVKGTTIGCKNSDGVLQTTSNLYKTEKVNEEDHVFLFKYYLKNCIVFTEVQKIVNNTVFISLRTDYGKEIKWTKKEINEFFNKTK